MVTVRYPISKLKERAKNSAPILFVLIFAAFFRLWQLDKIPPGLYPDVAINGNDALDSLRSGNFKLFYPENNGREGLFMWLIAFSFKIFGPNILTIKIVPALIGILTVLGVYLLTKELFQNTKYKIQDTKCIALLSSFFLAISFWHVNFSRLGFRAIMVPFVLVFSLYFLLKGFRDKKLKNFIISGIFFGLGFYTYISFRLAVLLIAAIFGLYWLVYRKQNAQRRFLLVIGYWLLVVFIVSLPIGLYFLQNFQDFSGRTGGVSIFSQPNPLISGLKSLILHLGMFNFYGDQNWRHNFAGSPMLFGPVGILFLLGIIISVKNLIKSALSKNHSLLATYYVPIIWFFVMLLPGILTHEGLPHALRVIGVIPPVFIFTGFGAWEAYELFYKNTKHKKLLFATCFIFLSTMIVVEYDRYFNKWGKAEETKNAFSADFVDMGNYLNSLPDDIQKYVIVNLSGVAVPYPDGLPMPSQTPMFIERAKFGKTRAAYFEPKNLDQIKPGNNAVIVFMNFDTDLFYKVYTLFPYGEFQLKNNFWVYQITSI